MIINMVGGGGGAALNFKVVPGLTQPGTASENTIWVKTEKIGSWYFSATQPEEMQEWDVWFPTGTESDYAFNALRKNAVQVYPISGKQMVNGVLEKIDTWVYQNGEWTYWWNGELYENGNEFESVTGGWQAIENNTYFATVTKSASAITLSAPGTAGYSGLCGIKNSTPIDLTKYNTLRIRVTSVNSGGSVTFGIMKTYDFSGMTNFLSAVVASKECKSVTTYDLDISSVDEGLPFVKVGSTYSVTFDLFLLK